MARKLVLEDVKKLKVRVPPVKPKSKEMLEAEIRMNQAQWFHWVGYKPKPKPG